MIHQDYDPNGPPVLYRSVANERIYDDVSNNFSHQDDILDLSQEMTYMGIEPP